MEKSEATNMGFTVESFFIILVTVLIIVCNVLVLCVVFLTDRMDSINKYFFVSLTISDLAVGMFVAPFSIWPSIAHKWMFGTKFCYMEAYLAAIFWIASIYSLMWISIDHYVAIRKPDRYESLMTPMKCLCWVALVWVAALSFCCPPLFAESRARYYQEAFICIIDWNFQRAYIITSGTLVVVPPIIALVVSNSYIFTATYRQKRIIYEKCTESNSRPEHYFTNMIICCVFLVTWLPWCSLQMHDVIHNNSTPSGPPALHFYLMWLAVGNSIWKFLMYVIFDHDFRIGLKIMYLRMSCSDWNT